MEGEDAPALRVERILGALQEQGVKYVLVGGVAGTYHGASRATTDVDICPAWDQENLRRLAEALRSLGALEKGGRVMPDAQLIHSREVTNWRSPFGDVDVLLGIPEKSQNERAQYRKLAEDALVVEVGTDSVLVASLPALIRSKEIADRQKDHEALPELRALEAAQRSQQPRPPQARTNGPTAVSDRGQER